MHHKPTQNEQRLNSADRVRTSGSARILIRFRPVPGLAVAGVLLACAFASPAWAVDYTWVAYETDPSGNWSDANHWSPAGGPPGVGDTATIDLTGYGAYTVTLNANTTVDGFTLNSAEAEFYASGKTFTVDGPSQLTAGTVLWRGSTWTGTGTITNDTSMICEGYSTISSTFVQNNDLLVRGSHSGGIATLTVAEGFTNSGTITLETDYNGFSSNLTVTTGTLTNDAAGVILVEPGTGGTRQISANLVNNGTIDLNTPTIFYKVDGVYTNNTAFNIAAAGSLTINGNNQTFNQDGGTLTIDGAFTMITAAFNFNGGTITPKSPILRGTALSIGAGATGAANFTMQGSSTLSGDIQAGQTVLVEGSYTGGHASLTSANGFTNAGTITLETSYNGYYSNLIVTTGTLNIAASGVINVNPGDGGARTISADLTNDGTINLNTPTSFTRNGGIYTNNAAFNIASDASLAISGNSQTFNQEAGTLAIDGAFNMGQNTFNFNGGTITGTPLLDDSALNIGESATTAASFTMHGLSTLSGDISAGQTILVEGSYSDGHALLTAAEGFTNAGTITLETAYNGYNSHLTVTTGTLTNAVSGVIDINLGDGGPRTISADITNNGTINVNTPTTFSKSNGVCTNNNAFNIAADGSLTINYNTHQTFSQEAGTLAIAGAFHMKGTNIFNFNGGTITGNPILDDAALNIGPGSTGAGFFTMRGNSTLSGDIAEAQTVWVQGSNIGSHTYLTAAASFTNAGTIMLESIDSAYYSNLTVTTGTLTNAGTGVINVNTGSAGARVISADLTNNGTVNMNTATTFSKSSGICTNNAEINIAAEGSLTINYNTHQTFNQEAGTLAVAGAFHMKGTNIFNFNGGTITGNPILDDSALNIGPGSTGAGFFTLRGNCTLSGDIAEAQTVWVQGSSAGQNANLTAAVGFTNAGTIMLESIDSAYNSYLTVTDGTLTNASPGVINVNAGTGGARRISADLTNDGTVNVNTATSFTRNNGVCTNNAEINIAAESSLTIHYNTHQTFNQEAGTLAIAGAFHMNGTNTFNFNGGAITGNPILDDAALNIGPGSTGAGFFTVHGNSTLSGDIAEAQTVWVQGSSAGQNANLTAAVGFTNAGTITLESIDSGYYSYLTVTAGTLTNASGAVISVNAGTGGARIMSLELDNQGTANFDCSATLGRTEANHVNSGDFTITSDSAIVTLTGDTFTNAAGGVVAGIGTLKPSSLTSPTFAYGGEVQPGLSAGVLTVSGDCAPTSAGTLEIELGGTVAGDEYDQLAITGAADLDGILNVVLIDAFTPVDGDIFTILTADAVTGTFATLNLPALTGDLIWGIFYDADRVVIGVGLDCNENGVADVIDILAGTSPDCNGNGIPDECEDICCGDSNCDGTINWRDIDYFVAAMNDNVAAWEAMFLPGTPTCPFGNNDLNGDETVNWRDIDPIVAVMNTTCPF
ncbi:MAG: hypothetical protein KAY37_16330 [Phycisphaerae bacterium]|nr:hypothetical protein [Phycisphaerae bacterium]